MPRSTVFMIIIAACLALCVVVLSFDIRAKSQLVAEQRQEATELEQLAAAQADRDLHVQIAVRARDYTLRSYSNELDDSTRTAAFIESQDWLDSLKAGE